MAADIVGGLHTFLSDQLSIEVWDGEIPRKDTDDVAIDPTTLPVYQAAMTEAGMQRSYTTESVYADEGEIIIRVFGKTRLVTHTNTALIDELLNDSANWDQIVVGTTNRIYHCLVDSWTVVQMEGIRLRDGSLLYKGELRVNLGVEGLIGG